MLDQRYQQIVAAIDAEFARNCELHRDKIHCRPGCTDCCHHSFQITAIEAAEIARAIEQLDPQSRESIEARAREYVESRNSAPGTRLPCPALDQGVCSIYAFRPLICHKFGMPIYNPDRPDRILACELNFKNGEEIEDSMLVQIQTGIHQVWKQLQTDYSELHPLTDRNRLTVAEAILLAGR
jgi:Fe-S-cluster containining protein